MTNGDDIVVTSGLARRFGQVWAVRNVSLRVHGGEIFGVLGPNGAGKSTTIRMLCGILDPTSGEGKVVGYNVGKEAEKTRKHQLAGSLSGGWKQRVARPKGDMEQRLLAKARKCFLAHGFGGTSLRHVAREAGTSVGMIHYYYKSKKKLFQAVVETTTTSARPYAWSCARP